MHCRPARPPLKNGRIHQTRHWSTPLSSRAFAFPHALDRVGNLFSTACFIAEVCPLIVVELYFQSVKMQILTKKCCIMLKILLCFDYNYHVADVIFISILSYGILRSCLQIRNIILNRLNIY